MTRSPIRGRGHFAGSYPDIDKRIDVLELRSQGLTFREIGRVLGVSHQAAAQMWQRMAFDVDRPPQARGRVRV